MKLRYLSHVKDSTLKKVSSRQELVEVINKKPLKKSALMAVTKKFHFSNKQAAAIGGMGLRTYQRQKNTSDLSVSASESVLKLAEVYESGMKAFDNNVTRFVEWLNASIPALNNRRPVDLLMSGRLGAEIVNDELLRIEYGIFA
jgi:putative toxin-antitoxin system antitoxin component (TIGR02293 family)